MRKIFAFILIFLCARALTWAQDFSGGTGTLSDPYQIASADDWDTLRTYVANGQTYADTYFKLTANIHVETMVGTSDHNFSGHFDGDGKTLEFTCSTEEQYNAPFRYVDGVTIKNLRVTSGDGQIDIYHKFASGLIAHAVGNNSIINCRNDVKINSHVYQDGTHGSFVSHIESGATTIEGCVYEGKYYGDQTTCCGGFVGWVESNNNATLTITNCVFQPSDIKLSSPNAQTFARARNDSSLTITNCYYGRLLGGVQGKQRRLIRNGDNITVTSAAAATATYNVSNITAYETGLTLDGLINAAPNESLSINITDTVGYNEYHVSGGTLTGTENPYTLTMPDADVTITGYKDPQWSGTGTENDPYIITSGEQWDLLAKRVNKGNTYVDTFFVLGNDIQITKMVGDSEHKFSGHFNGDGHKLVLEYYASTTSAQYSAPFRYVDGVFIENLYVTCQIRYFFSSNRFASGLIAHAEGNNYIVNCHNSVKISNSYNGDCTHGTFVSHIERGSTTIEGCVFDGRLENYSARNCGGFVGWVESNNNATLTIVNSVFKPAYMSFSAEGSQTFARARNDSSLTITNCYYSQTLGGAQGNQMRAVKGGDNVTVTLLASSSTDYDVSNIIPYNDKNIVVVDGRIYATPGESMNLAISDTADYDLYIVNAGTLIGTEDPYTLTMANSDATISGLKAVEWSGTGTEGDPYIIASDDQWKLLVNRVVNGNTYSGQYFQLGDNLNITYTVGADGRPFSGNFDGDGHTLSFDFNTNEDFYAPFRYTDGASFKNLKITGNMSTSAKYAAGLAAHVGENGITLTNVTSNVIFNCSYNGAAYHGGLVAYAIQATFEGCSFTGKLNGYYTEACGGLLGYKTNDAGKYATFTNCFFAPSYINASGTNSFTFGGGTKALVTCTKCYYTLVHGAAQGTQVFVVTAGDHVTSITPHGTPTNYNVSDITFYAEMDGMSNNSVVYIAKNLPLTMDLETDLVVEENMTLHYDAPYCTLTGSANPYTMTSDGFESTIRARIELLPWSGSGTDEDPFLITNAAEWDALGTNVANEFDYRDKTFKLANDISVTTMVGEEEKYFRGTFDGDGNTLTINITNAGKYSAPFKRVFGGLIKNLKTAGTIDGTGNPDGRLLAGIVGITGDNARIRGCISSITLRTDVGEGAQLAGIAAEARYSTIYIDGCIFNGSILGSSNTKNSGIMGEEYHGYPFYDSDARLKGCLFDPAVVEGTTDSKTISRHSYYYSSNCCYTHTMGDAQNNRAYVVDIKPANIGNLVETFEKIDLTLYENGMKFGDKYYVGGSIGLYNNTTGSGPKNDALISNIATNYPDEDVNIKLSDHNIYADNCWNTLCLPFSLTEEQLAASPLAGFHVEELNVKTDAPGYATGYYNNTLYLFFKEATSIEAGKPYILRKYEDGNPTISNPVFENVRVVDVAPIGVRSADHTVTFMGRYASLYYGSANHSVLLLGASNTLYYPQAESFLGACRAYFQLHGITAEDPEPGAPGLRIVLNTDEENTATDLSHGFADRSERSGDKNSSNLSEPLEPAKFFRNGAIYILRDGIIYDALGRKVSTVTINQ